MKTSITNAFLYITIIYVSYLAGSPLTHMVEIPVSFDRANVPIVEFTIDKKIIKFYLDTGAKGIHLPKDIADSIHGIKLTGRKVKSVDLSGKVREDNEFVIPELHINGMTFKNVVGQYLSAWGLGESEFELPVIGFDLLLQKELILDYPGKRLLMSDERIAFNKLFPSTQELEIKHADEGLIIFASIGKHKWPFVLDCGASISIIKTSADVEKELITPCTIKLPTGDCEKVNGSIHCSKETIDIELIRMPLPDQFKPMGVIGYNFLSKYAVYLSKNNDMIKISSKSD